MKMTLDNVVLAFYYVALGALLAIANIWFIRSVWRVTHPEQQSPIIAPFNVIGVGGVSDDKRGIALAHMLQTKVDRIDRQMQDAQKALSQAADIEASVEQTSIPATSPPPSTSPLSLEPAALPPAYNLISLPREFIRPLNLNISVSGVQVGGIIEYLRQLPVRHRMLQITVVYTANQKARVSGYADVRRKNNIDIEDIEGDDGTIVDAIAYDMVRYYYSEVVSPTQALNDWTEFRLLLQSLREGAKLNEQARNGRADREKYAELLVNMVKLAGLLPTWKELVLITAQTAENAGKPETAVQYYLAAVDFPESHDDNDLYYLAARSALSAGKPREALSYANKGLDITITEEEKKRRIYHNLLHIAAQAADAAGEKEQALEKYSTLLALKPDTDPVYKQIDQRIKELKSPAAGGAQLELPVVTQEGFRAMLGVSDLGMTRTVTIAIAGGRPLTDTWPLRMQPRIIQEPRQTSGEVATDDVMGEYLTTISAAVAFVAPNVEFVFTDVPAPLTLTGLLESIERMVSANQDPPDILLVPLSASTDIFQQYYANLTNRGILVVHAAGNRGGNGGEQTIFDKDLAQRYMLVSSVDEFGRRAPFTTDVPEGTFWAPGVNVPLPIGDRIDRRSGTGYSAALAAGIAARVIAEHETLDVSEVMQVLRDTSREIVGNSGAPVLNLGAALGRLKTGR